jgi:hypothetical protein
MALHRRYANIVNSIRGSSASNTEGAIPVSQARYEITQWADLSPKGRSLLLRYLPLQVLQSLRTMIQSPNQFSSTVSLHAIQGMQDQSM